MRNSTHRPAVWSLLWLLLAGLCISQSVMAQQQYDFSAGLLYGGLYAPEQWNAVNLSFRNSSGQPVDGDARLPINRDAGGLEMHLPVYVPAMSRVRMVSPVFMPPLAAPLRQGDRVPPVSTIAWHDNKGARIARSELVGQGLSAEVTTDASGLPGSGFVLSVVDRDLQERDEDYASQVVSHLKAKGIHCSEPTVVADALPGDAAMLSPCRAVALRGTNPDSLTQSQRTALLAYVRAGGVLLLPSPRQSDGLEQSWLAPYLPVRLVGWRQAKDVGGIPLVNWLNVTEATDGGGAVLLREGEYVHAAYRQVGLGRVVFTSFPLSGLVPKHARSGPLWQQLLAVERPVVGMEGTRLRRDYGKFLEPMLGRPAAPWGMAATTIVIYLAIILGLQVWYRGAARPQAFAAALGVALVIALVFVVMTAMKRQSASLQSARVAIVDVGDGGGAGQEVLAYAGTDDDDFSLAAGNDRVLFHPIFNQGDKAVMTQPPLSAPKAGVSAERVARVWEARWPAGEAWEVKATAAFTEEGLSLRVKNGSQMKLEDGQLVWKRERFLVGDIGAEERKVLVGEGNLRPRGEFMTAAGIASQDQRLKGDILAALLDRTDLSPTVVSVDTPSLVAWVMQSPQMLSPSMAVKQQGDQTLLRAQVLVEPTRKGQKIRIDSPLSRIDLKGFRGLPYNVGKDEWTATNMPGQWLVAVRAPVQAGTIRPGKVRLTVEFDAPAYTISLRRGQVRGGKAGENPGGALVKEWAGPIGPLAPVEFECEKSDYDAEGRIWLLLDVKLPSRPASGLIPFWKVVRFATAIDGEVIAPPADHVLGVQR